MEKIRVFVRLPAKGDGSTREISFRIPEGLSSTALIDEGWAIDGNQAIKSVQSSFDDFKGRSVSMAEMLLHVERELIEFLRKHNREVDFV